MGTKLENEDEELFSLFDLRNEDGRINKRDLVRLNQITNGGLTFKEIDELFKVYDTDQDGCINFREFTKMIADSEKTVSQ